MNKLLFGKGYNDLEDITQKSKRINGKEVVFWRDPYYDRWTNMLRRCYSENYQRRFPTYKGCSVCDEWLTFSNFRAWMETQDWEGKELDKDLLSGVSKIYSPSTCGFVGKDLNNYIIKRYSKNNLPLGVSEQKNKYQKVPRYRARFHDIAIHGFTDPVEAHRAWQMLYINQGLTLIEKYPQYKDILQKEINRVSEDLNNTRETLYCGIGEY